MILRKLLINSVYAITGTIGNAKMILRGEIGDTIERSILVRNVNDVKLNIKVFVTGDLAKNIELKEEEFELEPGEEKKVYFTIYADEPGTYESKINVQFTPEEGNGVGLSSTIILIAKGEGNKNYEKEENGGGGVGGKEEIEGESEESEKKSKEKISINKGEEKKETGKTFLIITNLFVFFALTTLFFLIIRKNKRRFKKKK